MSVLSHFVLWSIGVAKPRTLTTAAMQAALARHARGRRRVVEIGCLYGVNTCNLRRAIDPAGVVFAVDPYPPGRLGVSFMRIIAQREVGRVANGTVRWLRMTDLDAAAWFDSSGEAPVEMIFSDAVNTREGFRAAWEAWSRRLAPGGIYALNSVIGTPSMPIHDADSAVYYREAIRSDPRYELVEEVDNMVVLRRREDSAAR